MDVIDVAKDFTRFPAGRYKRNGTTSGEAFRERFLEPALREGKPVTVQLDGTIGYGSSFLEEAFGGAVRSLRMPSKRVLELVTLKSADPDLIAEIQEYVTEAGARLAPRD